MPYIHELSNWPRFLWDEGRLASLLGRVRHRQGLLLGRMGALGFQLRREASLTTLTTDVVTSSAIEGENLDAGQVRSSIARKLGVEIAGAVPATRHVDGIVEMMLDATQKYAGELNAERLFGWHASLFPTGHSGVQKISVGRWRPIEAGRMLVVSMTMGMERVHFEAPSAERLDAEMSAFLEWFNQSAVMDPVAKAALAHFWFITIHPFEDGNGRIARAIADMALARADGCAERFYSMSSQIEIDRKDYYLRLESSQRGTLDVTLWMEWFLQCLERTFTGAEGVLERTLKKARIWGRLTAFPANDRQRLVVNRLLDGFQGHLNTSKYAKLAKCSADTALRDIHELLQRGLLIRNESGGRSTSYQLSDPAS